MLQLEFPLLWQRVYVGDQGGSAANGKKYRARCRTEEGSILPVQRGKALGGSRTQLAKTTRRVGNGTWWWFHFVFNAFRQTLCLST